MNCPNCNHTNVPQAQFCAQCGTRLPQPGIVPQPVQKTKYAGIDVSAKDYLLIGRAPDCDIVINDDSVSSKHAKIFKDRDNVIIEDLGSMNGVIINGKRITTGAILYLSDNVKLGSAFLNLNYPEISRLFSSQSFATPAPYSHPESVERNFGFNKNFVGKIVFAVMIAMLFLPWLKVDLGEGLTSFFTDKESFSFTAINFALNTNPFSKEAVNYNDMPFPAHTLCLTLIVILILGFVMNFINLKISNQFNVVNIVSIVILSITIAYMYLFKYNNDKAFIEQARFGIGIYIFMIFCIISAFEGLIEYFIKKMFQR
ncbi:MAG TPA: FHA domain-containing protein [Ignavibacteria bacterium]